MGRKGRIFSYILKSAVLTGLVQMTACMPEGTYPEDRYRKVQVTVKLETSDMNCKSSDCGDITDVSLIVFNDEGLAERCIGCEGNESEIGIELILGRTYSFYACSGFGYRVSADHISEMDELTYHITDPRDAEAANVMCGCQKSVRI